MASGAETRKPAHIEGPPNPSEIQKKRRGWRCYQGFLRRTSGVRDLDVTDHLILSGDFAVVVLSISMNRGSRLPNRSHRTGNGTPNPFWPTAITPKRFPGQERGVAEGRTHPQVSARRS